MLKKRRNYREISVIPSCGRAQREECACHILYKNLNYSSTENIGSQAGRRIGFCFNTSITFGVT